MVSMPVSTIGFRPTEQDERILRKATRAGETVSDTLRRAIRLLDYDEWLHQARGDALSLTNEKLNDEPEAW